MRRPGPILMKVTRLVLGLVLGLDLGSAWAQNLLPNAQQTFTGANGTILAGGFVFTYIPNTTTAKMTWQDQALSVPNSNPIVLDSNGQARIWGNGSYRQVVLDANSSLVWDQITTSPSPGNLAGTACTNGHLVSWDTGGTSLGCDPATSIVQNDLDVVMSNGALLTSSSNLYLGSYSQLAGTRLRLGLSGSVSDALGSFRDGLYVQVIDSDLTTYTKFHSNNAGRFAVFGPNVAGVWQTGDKNYIGLNAYCVAATSGTLQPAYPPGCNGIVASSVQMGAGFGINSFTAQQPSAANGSVAQAKGLAGIQAIVDANFADADATHSYYGVLTTNFGTKIASAAFGANGAGKYKSLLQSGGVAVTESAIVMPHSDAGDVGTIIDYGTFNGNPAGGSYTRWTGTADGGTYSWVDSGNYVMSVGVSGLQLNNSGALLAPPALVNGATGPFVHLTSMAGTPTGVPTLAGAGATACAYDTTAHKMWCYDQPAGLWKFAQFN